MIRTSSPTSSGLLRRFRVGVGWSLVAVVLKQGSTFAVNIIIAHVLGSRLLGQYAVVVSTVQTFATLGSLGMGYTATKYVAELRIRDKERAGRILGLCALVAMVAAIAVAAVLIVGARWLSLGDWPAQELAPVLRVAAIAAGCVTVSGFLAGALTGLEAYSGLATSASITAVVQLGAVAGLSAVLGVRGAVLALLIGSLCQLITLQLTLRHELRRQNLRVRFDGLKSERTVLVRFAIPGALSGLTAAPALWLGQLFLAQQPDGFHQVALYTAAYSFMAMVLLSPNVANSVGMSLLNNALGDDNHGDYRRVFWINLGATLALVFCGVFAFAVLGNRLFDLYGPGFRDAYQVLLILLAASVPEGLTIACNQVLQSREKMWHAIAYINVPRDALLISAAWILVPRYGAAGLAISYFCARALAALVILPLAYKFAPRIAPWRAPAVSSAVG